MIRTAVLALPALILAGGAALAQDHGGKVDWVRDPRIGLARAKLEGRIALLYFTASW